MFGLSFPHLILLGVIALIFLGPEQLPQVARTIGQFLNELKRATHDFRRDFTGEVQDLNPRRWADPEPEKKIAPQAPTTEDEKKS